MKRLPKSLSLLAATALVTAAAADASYAGAGMSRPVPPMRRLVPPTPRLPVSPMPSPAPFTSRPQPPAALPPLREAYIKEVEALKGTAAELRKAGKSEEAIARTLHQKRRDIGVKYKDLTPPEKREEIYQRNQKLYGDKLGPTIDNLIGKGKTWEQIIESASRTGGADLGLAKPE
jgi:hypothetical protein